MLKTSDDAAPIKEVSEPIVENAGQDQQPVDGENKPVEVVDGAPIVPVDGVSTVDGVAIEPGQEQPPLVDGEPTTQVTAQSEISGKKPAEGEQPEDEQSESEVESEMDSSDYDVIEDEIDPSLWKKVRNFDDCDFKPEKKDPVKAEGAEGEEAPAPVVKASRKKASSEDDEDNESEEKSSGGVQIEIRSEKQRDTEFREYVSQLCRPHIISYLKDRIAAKGTAIRLTCTVEGNNVQAAWKKNGVNLDKSKNVQYKSDGQVHTLDLLKLTDRDAGEYTCIFKNRAGEVETIANVKVFDGKLHKPDHIDIALVKGENLIFYFTLL